MHLPARWRTVVSGAGAALAAVALTAAPASAAPTGERAGCPDVPTVQPFTAWQDVADYVLAPGGDIESDAQGWILEDGAQVVEGSSPFAVGGPADHRSLALPPGASATTPSFCIGEEHETMRFFGASTGTSPLRVEALYTRTNGTQKRVTLGTVGAADEWAPTDSLPMRVNDVAGDYGNALSVSLRFTARGNAAWQIDDVYVDPYRMK